jgi:hypothetical protein
MLTSFPKANDPFVDWLASLDKIKAALAMIMNMTSAQTLAARSSASAGNAAIAAGDAYAAKGTAFTAQADAMLAIDAAKAALAAARTPEEIAGATAFLEGAEGALEAANSLAESAAALTLAASAMESLAAADLLGESIAGMYASGVSPTQVTVNVAGNVTTEQDLVDAVSQGLYEIQKRGQSITLNAVAI